MKALEYLEKIDDTLSNWEDYFHGQEGVDVTEARSNLDKIRKQLTLTDVNQQRELLFCGGCGNKKQLIVETDINNKRVCKNKLCKQNNCG